MTTNPFAPIQTTVAATDYLERLAKELDVPQSRYEEASKRYKSVGEWLDRDQSSLKDLEPDVYVQGSFGLGTPIRPVNEDEHYDVDLVCELKSGTKKQSQRDLKHLLGDEMNLYAKAHNMKDLGEGRRCWTLEYADGAQFHLDALPAIPDASRQRTILASRNLDTTWSDTAIAITDNEHRMYERVSDDWPLSNPRGYVEWFRSRMAAVFEARRGTMALQIQASIDDIPSYRVKTPLQQAVQILKRHRDVMFAKDPEHKPISIILTTLAGQAYQNESSVAQALESILQKMPTFIGKDSKGNDYIANPTNPAENFADRWQKYPERRRNFYKWLEQARSDFRTLMSQSNSQLIVEAAAGLVGRRSAVQAGAVSPQRVQTVAAFSPGFISLLNPTHKLKPTWPIVRQGKARISKATWRANGYSRPMRFYSDSAALMKSASLTFEASTDVPAPFDVYWQVVNTGTDAVRQNGLRGGFEQGSVERGSVIRRESTSYSGAHTIECFIVKQGYLVARSGAFIVNIA